MPELVAVCNRVGLKPTRIDIHQCFEDEQPATDNREWPNLQGPLNQASPPMGHSGAGFWPLT